MHVGIQVERFLGYICTLAEKDSSEKKQAAIRRGRNKWKDAREQDTSAPSAAAAAAAVEFAGFSHS